MFHLPLRATSSLLQTLHNSNMSDDDDDDDGDDVLVGRSLRRGISENMFTNASSSVFITNLMFNHNSNRSAADLITGRIAKTD